MICFSYGTAFSIINVSHKCNDSQLVDRWFFNCSLPCQHFFQQFRLNRSITVSSLYFFLLEREREREYLTIGLQHLPHTLSTLTFTFVGWPLWLFFLLIIIVLCDFLRTYRLSITYLRQNLKGPCLLCYFINGPQWIR